MDSDMNYTYLARTALPAQRASPETSPDFAASFAEQKILDADLFVHRANALHQYYSCAGERSIPVGIFAMRMTKRSASFTASSVGNA